MDTLVLIHFMENKDRDQQLKQGLQDYLTCEKILNELFTKFDFCQKKCFSKDIGLYRTRMDFPGDPIKFPGYVGCCSEDGFLIINDVHAADRTLLDDQRTKIYGGPNEESRYCGYHTAGGCRLNSHKSPTCLAYVCPTFASFLNKKKGINYPNGEIEKSLELILAGKKSTAEVLEFQNQLKDLVNKVK